MPSVVQLSKLSGNKWVSLPTSVLLWHTTAMGSMALSSHPYIQTRQHTDSTTRRNHQRQRWIKIRSMQLTQQENKATGEVLTLPLSNLWRILQKEEMWEIRVGKYSSLPNRNQGDLSPAIGPQDTISKIRVTCSLISILKIKSEIKWPVPWYQALRHNQKFRWPVPWHQTSRYN